MVLGGVPAADHRMLHRGVRPGSGGRLRLDWFGLVVLSHASAFF
jgi:hypothetical protein